MPVQPSSLDQEQAALQTFYRAFSQGKTHLLNQAVTDDWRDIPLGPGQGLGAEGFKPLLNGFLAAIPDMQIVVLDVLHIAGRAGVRAELRGTHQGELMGVGATGRAIRLGIHEFHEFREGRIATTWHMEDWLSVFRALGRFPPISGQSALAVTSGEVK